MKKFTAVLLFLKIAFLPLYALNIEDSFADNTLDKNLKIKQHKYSPIVDTFAQNNKAKNPQKKVILIEETLPDMPVEKFRKRPVIFDDNCKEIKVGIKNYYTSKNNLEEGDVIEFKTLNKVIIKDKVYDENTTVKARLETVSKNRSFGVPSDVVISNFTIGDTVLSGEISKTGANRTLWLRPLVTNLIPFFGVGLLFIPIRGGHAKIKPDEVYTLYITE